MEQISTNIGPAASTGVTFQKTAAPSEQQPKVSLEDPKDTFERSSGPGKGVLLVTGAAGAAGAGFGVQPLARKIVNKKIDAKVDEAQKLVKKMLTEDVSEEEFLSAYKKLDSMGSEVMTIIADKAPGIAKDLAPQGQGEAVSEAVKKFFETMKKNSATKLTDDEIKTMGKNLIASRNSAYDTLAHGIANSDLSESSKQINSAIDNIDGLLKEVVTGSTEAELSPLTDAVNAEEPRKLSGRAGEIIGKLEEKQEGFAKYLGFKDVEEMRTKKPEELGKAFRAKAGESINNAGNKVREAVKPLKESLVEHFVKIPGKYKAISAVIGGLSVAGLVALVRPSNKSSKA